MLPRYAELWLPGLVKGRLSRNAPSAGPAEVYFCLADHYEPRWRGADISAQRERVDAWIQQYPVCASRHQDSNGRAPQHTFFFPEEEYHPEHLDKLADLSHAGWGDVEVHLHHDQDTAAGLREKLDRFTKILVEHHGLLRRNTTGQITYGFIHGNWALNNSRGDGRWCGVDDETSVLLETGCYADFTMPCGPEPSQSRTVNQIYYTIPQSSPKAHDFGPQARAGKPAPVGLLMIPGPLALNWRNRKNGILPRLEYGDLAWHTPPSPHRVHLWCRQRVHVAGAPEHMFIKLTTHGAQDRNLQFLLSSGLDTLWSTLERFCSREGHRLHYMTAYEMYRKVRELENAVPDRPARISEMAGR